jgi:AcrR family transcriptional regulator
MARKQRLGLREQKHTMVRNEILRAATALFATRGYRAITIDHIAEAIGLTKSAMYYYFKNKYDLLSTIFHDSFAYYLTHAHAIAAQNATPEEAMRRLIRQHILNAIELREWTTIYFREQSELNDKDRAYITKCNKEYSELFERAYVRGLPGAFKQLPPMIVYNYIVGSCNSIIQWFRDDGDLDPQQVADMMTTIVEDGFRQKSSDVR